MDPNFQQPDQRKRKLQLTVLIVAVVLFALSLGLGVWAGLYRGRSLATYENANAILTALRSYKIDQTEFPSADQYQNQRILAPYYLRDYPVQVDHSGACGAFKDFIYSQTKPQNFTFQFCLSKAVSGLSAGVHTVTEQGFTN